jgi:hypothetical protein
MESQVEVSCREIVQFGEKLSIALSTLVELDKQESLKYVDNKFDSIELYKTILYTLLKARFGPSEGVWSQDFEYSLVYKCIEDNDTREAHISVIRSPTAGIIFTTRIFARARRTKVK